MFEDDTSGPLPAVRIAVKVVPGSRHDEIVGRLGKRLKIKVSAPPEDGKANKAVCRLLEQALGVNERSIEVLSGHASPEKIIRVSGKSAVDLENLWP